MVLNHEKPQKSKYLNRIGKVLDFFLFKSILVVIEILIIIRKFQ